MKTILATALFALGIGLAGCADMSLGVDVGSDDMSPYWYGNGYVGNAYWNTPVWNYGPIYNQRPGPPLIGYGPGMVRPNPSNRPGSPRPPQGSPGHGDNVPGVGVVPAEPGINGNRPSGNQPSGNRPSQSPGNTIRPGANGIGWNPGSALDDFNRPGNGGLPSRK